MNDQSNGIVAALLAETQIALPDPRAFLAEVNAALAPRGLAMQAAGTTAGGGLLFTGDRVTLELTAQQAQIAPARLALSLASPHTRAKPGVTERVIAHTAHLTVAARPLDRRGTSGASAAVGVVHRAVLALLALSRPLPSLIYWAQSETLHRPEEVLRTAGEELPLALILSAEPLSAGEAASGNGFVARGSELVCGRTMVVEPTPLHFEELRNLVEVLLLGHAAGDLALADGEIVPFSSCDQARLKLWPPDQRFPDGRISVIIEPHGAEEEVDEDATSLAFSTLGRAVLDDDDAAWAGEFLPLLLVPPVAVRIDDMQPSTLAFAPRLSAPAEASPSTHIAAPSPRRVAPAVGARTPRPGV